MAKRPDVLLFDLGGVLLDFSGVEELARLLPAPMTADAIKARWIACPYSTAYGSGEIDDAAFAQRFLADWGIDMPPAAFLAEYRSWARGWLPGATELLDELRPQFRLAALSNSNAAHWTRVVDDLGLADRVEVALSSHEIGVRKPDPRAFAIALDRLQVPAADVLFFDDAAGNVAAAREVGMQAALVDGPAAIRRHLRESGWL